MKRWIRTSIYGPRGAATTTVVAESDLMIQPAELYTTHLRSKLGYPDEVDIEIFEYPGPVEAAAMEAVRREKRRLGQRERHMGTVWDWSIAMLHMVKPGGLVQTTQASPLRSSDIRNVLMAVSQHPKYSHQRFLFLGSDGRTVELKDGTVVVWD